MREPYFRKIEVPYETENAIILFPVTPIIKAPAEITIKVPNKNPENYLKPLDVVWVKMKAGGAVTFCHVGVYLGKDKRGVNQVCHFSKEKQSEGAKITE